MRDPFGKVCVVGRGTRTECINNAFDLSDWHWSGSREHQLLGF
jgi:hypothetical protein